jgi:glycosyltransferase involved in cell wall biosynthesis
MNAASLRDALQLSVVIPAYNEENRLGGTLTAITGYLAGRDVEVLVVDDGSTDRTVAVAEGIGAPNVRVIRLDKNRGKGAAVRAGILASTGERVLFSDADLATPIDELRKLEAKLDDGYAIAIGSRALDGADIRVRQSTPRELMGKTFNVLVRALVVGGIKDTQCGFKLFRGDLARELFAGCAIDGFAFDVDILLRARRAGHRIAEVPVVWRHVEQSKVSPARDAARMLWDVVHLSRRRKS